MIKSAYPNFRIASGNLVAKSLFVYTHTGSSALLLPPASTSSARWIYGPTTGMLPANWPIVTRKSPNRMNKP